MNVRIPKYLVPILAAMKKKSVIDKIESKINTQDCGSNSFKRFQIGEIFGGYFENQQYGRYIDPGAQTAMVPRPW